MSSSGAWLVLRVPRSENAKVMSGVLVVDGKEHVATGASVPEVCEALAEKAPDAKPTLVVPLDGRHGLAHVVLEESQKRGWEFSRQVPAGLEMHLLDLQGADAETAMSKEQAVALLEQLSPAMGEAFQDNEIGESMGIGRQALTLCLHHFGAWHPFTFQIATNLAHASAGTGNDDNIRTSMAFVEYLLGRDKPAAYEGAQTFVVRLDELAQRCIANGNVSLATRLYDAAVEIARTTFGDEHGFTQQVVARKTETLANT